MLCVGPVQGSPPTSPPEYNPPQEELADEIKNREAANARLAMMEQVIPKLHEDLKNVQAQLVQSRMEVGALVHSLSGRLLHTQ